MTQDCSLGNQPRDTTNFVSKHVTKHTMSNVMTNDKSPKCPIQLNLQLHIDEKWIKTVVRYAIEWTKINNRMNKDKQKNEQR